MLKLGKKWTCCYCKTKFYDLNKIDAVCPNCKIKQKDIPKIKTSKKDRINLQLENIENDFIECNNQRDIESLNIETNKVNNIDNDDLFMNHYEE